MDYIRHHNQFHSNPMQILGQLITAQNFQEPLKTLKTYLTFIENSYKNTCKQTDREIPMPPKSYQMNQMVDDMLAFSGMDREDTRLEAVNLNELIENTLLDLSTRITEAQAKIEFPHLPKIQADTRQIKHLFQNLIENALKYKGTSTPNITINYEEASDGHLFSVTDNGIGLENKYSEEIFRQFNRGAIKDNSKGTGLGLAVCKKIIENHEGKIWVESAGKGTGCTFYFLLPHTTKQVLKYMYEVRTDALAYASI